MAKNSDMTILAPITIVERNLTVDSGAARALLSTRALVIPMSRLKSGCAGYAG